MPLSGGYYYPVMQKPQSSLGGGNLSLVDGVPEPAIMSGSAIIFVDNVTGSLKVKFPDGTVKVLATDP